MAIKVNGTTVIDDSRNLSNVGGLKTVNGTSLVGSGNISAGASTTANSVGTYVIGRPENHTVYSIGNTASGIIGTGPAGSSSPAWPTYSYSWWDGASNRTTMSGTWRAMSAMPSSGNYSAAGLWVRIS